MLPGLVFEQQPEASVSESSKIEVRAGVIGNESNENGKTARIFVSKTRAIVPKRALS
jgi:hypothetical protein